MWKVIESYQVVARATIYVFPKMKEVPAHFQSPSPKLKAFTYDEILARATRNFEPTLYCSEEDLGKEQYLKKKNFAYAYHHRTAFMENATSDNDI
ncbi:hypothetical protein QVD17_14236 [Tagetes erecta]|uniref:Uncharacterized protein n=1 Tax=Tagetes erecta TaxID=13708 RepID=A0AAD8L333_TARER|nr:hypothetical protein QVD17_14236 [Tagetes erecta]